MDSNTRNHEPKLKKKKPKITSIDLNAVFNRLNFPSLALNVDETYLKNETAFYYNDRLLLCSKYFCINFIEYAFKILR